MVLPRAVVLVSKVIETESLKPKNGIMFIRRKAIFALVAPLAGATRFGIAGSFNSQQLRRTASY